MSSPQELIAACRGIKADDDLAHMFRQEVARLLGRTNTNFPGAQPVSFAARHIAELTRQDYYVMEKTDGIRFLMYLTREGPDKEIHYLIDRKNDYYYVPDLHFPAPDDPTYAKFHADTLLDGELVRDTYPNGKSELKYLVFDCLVMDGKSLMQRTLDKRLAYFKEMILKPYKQMYKEMPQEIQYRPFAVEDKTTQFSYGVEMMFKEVIPRVKKLHGNDGLIFTCRSTPYKIGTDEHILKWKTPEENTIDFVLSIRWQEFDPDPSDPDQSPVIDYEAFPRAFELLVYHGGNDDYRPWGNLYLTPKEWNDLKVMNKPLQDAVVECWLEPASSKTFSPHNNGTYTNGNQAHPQRWRFHRLREDKVHANHISTVESVMESIQDAVSQDDLISAAPTIRDAWKRRQTESAAGGRPASGNAPALMQHQQSFQHQGHGENGHKRKYEADGVDAEG
ncbi:putative mrna-capping enzyme subunit alpha [Phaeomoniella chlamydospora]|uniref:mRNA-capping enzyme subunit alpha n=1 Tax=Phaeomoniella chlamydospora TaxID=158046 RepID=A0A0G2EF52_PHACM|nr:putative mrna-capping enzyme subunit alpha [Phaeomoniella chlamydospora]